MATSRQAVDEPAIQDLFDAPAPRAMPRHRKSVAVKVPSELKGDPVLRGLLEQELARSVPRAGYINGIAIATADEQKSQALRALAKAVEERFGYARAGAGC